MSNFSASYLLMFGFFNAYSKIICVIASISAIYGLYVLICRPYKTILLQTSIEKRTIKRNRC